MIIPVTDRIGIDEGEIEFSFIRSSGPGGQNVNKLSTAVQLRFDVRLSPSLPVPVKSRLAMLAGSRLTNDGVLIITAQDHRSQERNRQEALARLLALVAEAAKPPPPKRRPTKPTKGSQERRLESKGKRSAVKSMRRSKPGMD